MTPQQHTNSTSLTPAPEPHWLNALPEPARERVFAAMRLLGDMAEKYRHEHQRLGPPHGQVAVGAAHMDPWFKAEAVWEFLRSLRQGLPPAECGQAARSAVQNAVRLHNAKRPRDVNWQRWEGTCEDFIDGMVRRVEGARA